MTKCYEPTLHVGSSDDCDDCRKERDCAARWFDMFLAEVSDMTKIGESGLELRVSTDEAERRIMRLFRIRLNLI